MDSFFSLFDPSEGQSKGSNKNKQRKPEQDNVKKKADAPKGRRRGRKCQGKQEPLPEESSFLCEPQLSGEVLVHGGYLDSYIIRDETKPDSDAKPKRRNSNRRNRRKKNKISPGKDIPTNAWTSKTLDNLEGTSRTSEEINLSLNNKFNKTKHCNDAIGKNVNDLSDYKKIKRKNSMEDIEDTQRDSFESRQVYNVIEKLEKVGLKDDMYLSGCLTEEDEDFDFFYSSEDIDESFDDTASDVEDSGDEAYGSLPPEPRFGNVEYKLQLVSPCERRFQHLVTQLKWRLRSGGGSAVYVVGVRDCGALRGLRARSLRASLRTLRRMAAALHATLAHVTARRLAPHRAVAEVYIRKLADTQQSIELRVAVLGANEAGKSTLIGVLTQGELDNGRGSARLNMFRHLHEVKSGRTSSLSHEILGFDAQGNVVNYGCSELMTAERIGERSAKLVSFLDLAGHSKYQRTTLHGLSGYSPHYAMIVISATAGITPITEEHIALLTALDLPFFVVISKMELAPCVPHLVARLTQILPKNKKPLLITDENAARNCVAPQKLILDAIDGDTHSKTEEEDEATTECVPVFPTSSVRGVGLNALHAYLLALLPPDRPAPHKHEHETCEFQIDEVFHMGDSTGPVVGGLLARGQLFEGDDLIIGPLEQGEFVGVKVTSVYRNRAPHQWVGAGHAASLGLTPAVPLRPRPGMVLLSRPEAPPLRDRPSYPGTCSCTGTHQIPNILNSRPSESPKDRKNIRRKNKNLLLDIAKVQNSLIKDELIENNNIYHGSEKDGTIVKDNAPNVPERDGSKDYGYEVELEKEGSEKSGDEKCTCGDQVMLEDPNDPRGCIYFQASVHVLRHPTVIYPGFQCTVHVGNVRQTAIIEGIMSHKSELRAGEAAPVMFRFARCPEYLLRDRRLLLTAGLATRAIGRITQTFPYVP
ncbi:GTP-binding protein 2-like [Pectinophora gossypiella]|nr:GTP-binding protein 2-like [Pectinophora gossypiella]